MLLLIGYRATGKTTLARLLGERLQMEAVDTDQLIERKAGRTIAEIFAEPGELTCRNSGETVFRDYESQVIAELLHGEPLVIATGGGLPVRPANRTLIKSAVLKRVVAEGALRPAEEGALRPATVVWLKASPETILRRMVGDPATEFMRPQLTNLPPLAEIEHLLNERTPIYREIADWEVDTDNASLPELVEKIAAWYQVTQETATGNLRCGRSTAVRSCNARSE